MLDATLTTAFSPKWHSMTGLPHLELAQHPWQQKERRCPSAPRVHWHGCLHLLQPTAYIQPWDMHTMPGPLEWLKVLNIVCLSFEMLWVMLWDLFWCFLSGRVLPSCGFAQCAASPRLLLGKCYMPGLDLCHDLRNLCLDQNAAHSLGGFLGRHGPQLWQALLIAVIAFWNIFGSWTIAGCIYHCSSMPKAWLEVALGLDSDCFTCFSIHWLKLAPGCNSMSLEGTQVARLCVSRQMHSRHEGKKRQARDRLPLWFTWFLVVIYIYYLVWRDFGLDMFPLCTLVRTSIICTDVVMFALCSCSLFCSFIRHSAWAVW